MYEKKSKDVIEYFQYKHLKSDKAKAVSQLFHDLAHKINNMELGYDGQNKWPEIVKREYNKVLIMALDPREKQKSLYWLAELELLIANRPTNQYEKEKCLDFVLYAKDAAVRGAL